MTKIFLLLLIGTLAAVTIAQAPTNEAVVPTESPHPTPHPDLENVSGVPPEPPKPNPHPEPVPVPSTSTTTTTPKPSTTSTAPTTTTTKPTSTTTKPSSTTTTTTSAPTTTKPSPKPTPHPAPKPVDPPIGLWQANFTNSTSCYMMVQFALQIEVFYNTTFNNTQSAYIDVPKNATATGEDKNVTQSITLKWNEVDQLILNFAKENGTNKYNLDNIEIHVTPTNASFPDVNSTEELILFHKHHEFSTSLAKSYKCAKKQDLNLTDSATDKQRGKIHVSHLQFEAFHNITNKQFSSAEDCAPYDTPDAVPIAVGCALAGLVLVVLIAYLIGRKRRQARGYLSM